VIITIQIQIHIETGNEVKSNNQVALCNYY